MGDLTALCMLARLTPEQFQKTTGISRRTFFRYQQKPPAWAVALCQLLSGELTHLHTNWDGWSINANGELCSPENVIFMPGELRSWFFRYEQLRALKVENEKLKKKITGLEVVDQPEPDEQINLQTIQPI